MPRNLGIVQLKEGVVERGLTAHEPAEKAVGAGRPEVGLNFSFSLLATCSLLLSRTQISQTKVPTST